MVVLVILIFPFLITNGCGSIIKRGVSKSATTSTCPCVRANGSGNCLAYDSKYQAVTLEEAVVNFLDLTSIDPIESTNIFGQKPSVSKSHCKSMECVACFQILTERLTMEWSQIGGDTAGLGLGLSNLAPQVINQAPSIHLTKQCTRLMPMERAKSNRSEEPMARLRNRRQAKPNIKTGVSTPLDCRFQRGDPSSDSNSAYVGLCNLCWSMRTLSSKYFPRYVNELSCNQFDGACLNGWGKCRERFRSIDVLYNYGSDSSPKWQQYSINSPISCECQVLSGSGLHNLVSH